MLACFGSAVQTQMLADAFPGFQAPSYSRDENLHTYLLDSQSPGSPLL